MHLKIGGEIAGEAYRTLLYLIFQLHFAAKCLIFGMLDPDRNIEWRSGSGYKMWIIY